MTIDDALFAATAAEFYICPDQSMQTLLTVEQQAEVDTDPDARCDHCGQRWSDHLHHEDCTDPACPYACIPPA